MCNLYDLSGKVAIVTGASSGLGADAARAYVQHGASVALLARRKDRIDALCKELQQSGGSAIAIQCDVTKEEQIKSAVDEVIRQFGKIDILLNNAGISVSGTVETLTAENWDRLMDTNLKSLYLMSKYVVPHMRRQNYGKIVNISSVNAILVFIDDPFAIHAYNAAKAGVIGLTKGMAGTYAKYNITVNAIGPGLFKTEMTKDTLYAIKEILDLYNLMNPAKRPGNDGELNGPILFFSSDASSYVNGQYLPVDGGATIA